jgi:hypothetical protein
MRRLLISFLLWNLICVGGASAASHPSDFQDLNFSGIDVVSGEKTDFSLKALPEKTAGVVVVFLSNVCPCSISHTLELTSLARQFQNFKFIGIHSNRDEKLEDAKIFFAKAGLPFSVLQDEKTVIADRFRANKTPHVFIVNANGQLVYKGGVTDSRDFLRAERHYLREALEDLSAGREVKTRETRSLGCAIARQDYHAH